jgi:periplasmic copper chaperone A
MKNMHQPAVRNLALILVAVLLIAACVPPPAASTTAGGGITITDPFSRTAPQEGGNGGAFMTITNGSGEADRLVAAESPAAGTVEIHETIDDNGVMRMRPVPDGFEIPAGGKLELKPGGKHIMLIGLVAPLEPGKDIELTLNFEKAGAITVTVPVRDPSAGM